MIHELKIKTGYLSDIITGKKTFEIRKNDRDYKVGDRLHLREIEDGEYTGQYHSLTLSYIFHGTGEYGLAEGYVILGLIKSNK